MATNSFRVGWLLVGGALGLPLYLAGAGGFAPHTFIDGEVASASEVNANFANHEGLLDTIFGANGEFAVPVSATVAALPSASPAGQLRFVTSEGDLYVSDGSGWRNVGSTGGSVGGTGGVAGSVLLLHADGDEVLHDVVVRGDATSIADVGEFDGSFRFDGAGDSLQVPASSDFNFSASDDFTIEMWARVDAITSSLNNRLVQKGANSSSGFSLLINGSTLYAGRSDESLVSFSSSEVVGTGQFHHIALTRSGSTWRLYRDGVLKSSANPSGNQDLTANNDLFFGVMPSNESSNGLLGYLDEIRISKGVARYTGATYTVPTEPFTADGNTSLLLSLDGDQAGSAHEVEFTQHPRFTRSTAKFGGSLKFNGSNQYAQVAASGDFSFGSDDFAYDFWMKLDGAQSGDADMLAQYQDGSNYMIVQNRQPSNEIKFLLVAGGSTVVNVVSAAVIRDTDWHHIAVTRSGDTYRLFKDGILLATDTSSTAWSINAPLTIGRRGSGINYLKGYMDEIRISKGDARWTANFTPPSAPYE